MWKSLSLLGSLAVAGAALLGASSAQADGFERAKGKGFYAPVPYHTWSGLYFGASIGGQWSDVTGNYVAPPTSDRHDTSPDSGIYGGHFGIQHQMGAVVVGIEAAVSGTGVFHNWAGGTRGGSPGCEGSAAPNSLVCQSHVDYLFTIGPRLGWAFSPSWMVYATGGYASANVRTRVVAAATGAQLDFAAERQDGWFIGAGIEWAITPSWIVGVEYQHVDLDSDRHRTGVVAFDRNIEVETDIVRARLSYKIGRPVPVHEGLK